MAKDDDKELRALIEDCMSSLVEEARTEYLLNCLTLGHYQGRTVKEIFQEELDAKNEFNAELDKRHTS